MSILVDSIGWAATITLTACSLPQLFLTWNTKNIEGLSIATFWWWIVGLLLMLVYVVLTTNESVLLWNYALNSVLCSLIIVGYYRAKRK